MRRRRGGDQSAAHQTPDPVGVAAGAPARDRTTADEEPSEYRLAAGAFGHGSEVFGFGRQPQQARATLPGALRSHEPGLCAARLATVDNLTSYLAN